MWEVVRGVEGGGLVVHEDKVLESLVAGRLRVGAHLEELEVDGERLHYRKLLGEGPDFGWVSTWFEGVELLEKFGAKTKPVKRAGRWAGGAPDEPVRLPGDPAAAVAVPEANDPLEGKLIWILAGGNRREVQPVVGLALQLRKVGCNVRLFAPYIFQSFIESYGLEFCSFVLSFEAFWSARKELWDLEDFEVLNMWLEQELAPTAKRVLEEMEVARPDLVIFTNSSQSIAFIAWRRGLATLAAASVDVHLQEAHYKHWWHFKHLQNVLAHVGVKGSEDAGWEEWMAFWNSLPMLVGTSSLMAQMLEPELQEAAAAQLNFTGHWVLENQKPIKEAAFFGSAYDLKRLQAFLEASTSPPAYLGWGGACCSHGWSHLVGVACVSLALANMRGVVATHGSPMSLEFFIAALHAAGDLFTKEEVNDYIVHAQRHILFVEAAPHEWLFRRCACTVHHGGVSTTAAALRAGVPMVVTPLNDLQYRMAVWVNQQGVGFGVEAGLESLSADDLSKALLHVTKQTKIRAKSRQLGRELRKDDAAVRVLGTIRKLAQEEEQPRAARAAAWESEHQRPEALQAPEQELPEPLEVLEPLEPGAAAPETTPPEEASLAPLAPEPELSETLEKLELQQRGAAAPDTSLVEGATKPRAEVWLLFVESVHDGTSVALGAGLARAGLGVKLFGSTPCEALAHRQGLNFTAICSGPDLWAQHPDIVSLISQGESPPEAIWWCHHAELVNSAAGILLAAVEEKKPDLLVVGRSCCSLALALHRRFRVPLMLARTTVAELPPEPEHRHPHRGENLAWEDSFLERAGLPPAWVPEAGEWFHLIDAPDALVAAPRLATTGFPPEQCDAFSHLNFTGFWTLDEVPLEAAEEQRVEAFLAAGRPPVLVTWGDVVLHGSEWMLWLALAPLRFAGLRGIIVAGSARLLPQLMDANYSWEDPRGIRSYVDSNVLFVEAIPPRRLLTHCLCAMHTGGIGGTAAILRAGLASVVSPMPGDQFYQSRLIGCLQVGLELGDFRGQNHKTLTTSLRHVSCDEGMQAHARTVGEQCRQLDGVPSAVTAISEMIETARAKQAKRGAG